MSLRNGMWHGLRNDIIMWNLIYAEWIELNCASLFDANQFANAAAVLMLTLDDNHGHEGSLSISLSGTATKILLAFISRTAWQHRYCTRKSAIEEKMFWKVTLPSTLIFSAKMFARLTLQFLFTYICICNRVRSVSFSNGGLRDRDIIFRDETDFFFFGFFFFPILQL